MLLLRLQPKCRFFWGLVPLLSMLVYSMLGLHEFIDIIRHHNFYYLDFVRSVQAIRQRVGFKPGLKVVFVEVLARKLCEK
jgi:hypothetical protein